MRVPPLNASPQTNSSPNPKLLINSSPRNNNNITFHSTNNLIPNLSYEPTSVLDLRRSPSPPKEEKPAENPANADRISRSDHHNQEQNSIEWEEHVPHNLDWDSILRDFGLNEDSNTPVLIKNNISSLNHNDQVQHLPEFLPSQPLDLSHLVHHSDYHNFNLSEVLYANHSTTTLPHNINSFDQLILSPPHESNNISFHQSNFNGFEFVEDILRAADCFDSNDVQLAHTILDRLNQRLQYSPTAKPLQRAAFYFKEALQYSLVSGSNNRTGSNTTTLTSHLSSWPEIVDTIRAHKAFSAISPFPMFSHLTTNQSLLEALNGSSFIHVIDFDIGLGGQYASFMKEVSEKAEARKMINPRPVLRITAIVPEEYATESRLVRENLHQFAQELKIRFQIDFVLLRTFETVSFKAVKFMDGEKVAVLLSPTIFRRFSLMNRIGAFLGDVRRVSPNVVVFVDSEGWTEAGAASFKRNLVDSLEFYKMVMESIDAAVAGGDWVRRIENYVLRPRILAAVEAAAAGRREAEAAVNWREIFHGAGLRPLQLSQFANFQANCLIGKVQVRGFHVVKQHAALVLCWHERGLVTTSAWRC